MFVALRATGRGRVGPADEVHLGAVWLPASPCSVPFAPRLLVIHHFLQVDPATGEIAGVFESIQPSDTDLGSKAPKDVKIIGLWYGQLTQ